LLKIQCKAFDKDAKGAGIIQCSDLVVPSKVVCPKHGASISQSLQNLKEIYTDKSFASPFLFDEVLPTADPSWVRSRVFYDEGDKFEDVYQLAYQREPVNIETRSLYKTKSMNTHFKYKTGYYNEYWKKHNVLPPNIGVYTPTKLRLIKSVDDADLKRQLDNVEINVFHAIGCALDVKEQTDYQYFFGQINNKQQRNKALKKFYRKVFSKILYGTSQILGPKATVVLSAVGAANFAELYHDTKKQFFNRVWLPALKDTLEVASTKEELKYLSFIGMGFNTYQKRELTTTKGLNNFKDCGYFPECVKTIRSEKYELSKVMFVNAWDPLSLPGNGHFEDRSLDGRLGRRTHVSLNGSPLTNPCMQFVSVPNFFK